MCSPLYEHIRGYRSLSLIGMCKNAGKTTVLGRILQDLEQEKRTLALTSIGRDGEAVDLVTGTKKPGIYVGEGTLLATAEQLLPLCDITREILATTGISTPMGEVIVLRARSDGNVQLAGPSTLEGLLEVSCLFRALGGETLIVDGAISRKTFCSRALTEAAVLCVGASCGKSMAAVVEDTRHTSQMLTLPAIADTLLRECAMDHPRELLLAGGEIVALPPSTGLADALNAHRDNGITHLFLPGALTDSLVRPLLLSGARWENLTLVAKDGAKVLLSADAARKLAAKGIGLGVLEEVSLAAVAVNPFSAYGNHFDREAFRRAMESAVDLPVVDVVEEQGGK